MGPCPSAGRHNVFEGLPGGRSRKGEAVFRLRMGVEKNPVSRAAGFYEPTLPLPVQDVDQEQHLLPGVLRLPPPPHPSTRKRPTRK